MTTQKIIDNIQTRLENLVSERFSGSYQQIDISCSNYNPTIDTSVTITITVTDQNGDPVTGFTVPLKIDGTSISGITTNSSGVATHTYNCTDWGNHKISVKSVSAFINVTGWKQVYNSNGVQIRTNGKEASINLGISNVSFTNSKQTLTTIPSQYAPVTDYIHSRVHPNNRDAWIELEGNTIYKWASSTNTVGVYCTIPTYPLATPLY